MIRLLGFLYFITHPSFWKSDDAIFHKELNKRILYYIDNDIDFRIKDKKAVAMIRCYYWRELDYIDRKVSCEVFDNYPNDLEYRGERNLAKLVRIRPSLLTQAIFYVNYVLLEDKWCHELENALGL